MTGKVSNPQPFRVRQDDVPQVPLVGQMSVSYRDADGEYLADRLDVDDESFRALVGRLLLLLDVVLVVLFEVMVEALWSRSPSRACSEELQR